MTAVDTGGIIAVTAYVSATVALLVLSARATSGIFWPTHRRKARARRRTRARTTADALARIIRHHQPGDTTADDLRGA